MPNRQPRNSRQNIDTYEKFLSTTIRGLCYWWKLLKFKVASSWTGDAIAISDFFVAVLSITLAGRDFEFALLFHQLC